MDKIISGLCCNDSIRIVAISARELIAEAQRTHGLSRVATAALGRQLMMTAMMAAKLKSKGDKITTIIAGDGVAKNMVCTGSCGGAVKGYTPSPGAELPLRDDGKLDVAGYVGSSGRLTVVSDLSLKEPYVGTCSLVSGEIAEDFAQYFMTSEQQNCIVFLGVNLKAGDKSVQAGGGLWISALPNCPDDAVDAVLARLEGIRGFARRLIEEDAETALMDIFEGLDFAITEVQPTEFRCDCSRERLEQALISLGGQELTDLIEQDGQAEVTCQFCTRRYHFTREELSRLLEEAMRND
ncbi:MAG: Hsp33 family molecular chaperone HslO [Clostridia bacterium]|nr:Hsp33 family molecular chaperone HslO [Clostridia bacterium]